MTGPEQMAVLLSEHLAWLDSLASAQRNEANRLRAQADRHDSMCEAYLDAARRLALDMERAGVEARS